MPSLLSYYFRNCEFFKLPTILMLDYDFRLKMDLELNREQVWEMYGQFLITYSMEIGWDELVRSMSPNLKATQKPLKVEFNLIKYRVFWIIWTPCTISSTTSSIRRIFEVPLSDARKTQTEH